PVPERPQLGLTLPGPELDRDLRDLETGEPGVNRQLEVELHAGTHWPNPVVCGSAEPTKPAIHVGVAGAEQEIENRGERRVADEPMQARHVLVTTGQIAATRDEVEPLVPQPVDKLGDEREVVGIVGIPHDQILTPRFSESLEICVPVAAPGLM